MVTAKLELCCPNNIGGIRLDPEPDWSMNDLISELNSLELKLNASSTTPLFTKMQSSKFSNIKSPVRSSNAFVMRISDDEVQDVENEVMDMLVVGKKFSCDDELYQSDTSSDTHTSDDQLALQPEQKMFLMDRIESMEALLSEKQFELQQTLKEEVRNKVSQLELHVMNENEKSSSALVQVEKYTKTRREMDKRLDMQYRRKTAEALDNHLIAVQREHQQRSQIEERKIRNDAAFEEAKRKERALLEEKARQEKAKAEAEAEAAVAKKRADEANKAALQAERIAKEAADKEATEVAKRASVEATQNLATGRLKEVSGGALQPKEHETNKVRSEGSTVRASETALKMEAERLQKFTELDEKNQSLKLGSCKDFRRFELQIGRHIRQISGTRESVRTKASELVKIINDPQCPPSVSIALFAKKVVSQCETLSANFDSTAFACGQVIVMVTSQVPMAMDILLAEFHRVCIYTVPKYLVNSQSALNKESYLKMLGYREDDGKLETTNQYLERIESYMKLYGVLVQTEVDGIQNPHGLKEGWAWLARLLNALPINLYTAVALEAFLKMAGYALHRKYKSQFKKILNLISQTFLSTLEARKDPKLNPIITKIKTYIDMNQFLKEPEGRRMQTSLLSEMSVPELESSQNQYYHQPNYHQSNRWSSYNY